MEAKSSIFLNGKSINSHGHMEHYFYSHARNDVFGNLFIPSWDAKCIVWLGTLICSMKAIIFQSLFKDNILWISYDIPVQQENCYVMRDSRSDSILNRTLTLAPQLSRLYILYTCESVLVVLDSLLCSSSVELSMSEFGEIFPDLEACQCTRFGPA